MMNEATVITSPKTLGVRYLVWRKMLEFEIKTGYTIKSSSICPIIKKAFGLKRSMRKEQVYKILDEFVKKNIMPGNTTDKTGVIMKPFEVDDGAHMRLEEFIEAVNQGAFIDYDGYGKYATATEVSNKIILPSHIEDGNIDRSFTHVLWYNR